MGMGQLSQGSQRRSRNEVSVRPGCQVLSDVYPSSYRVRDLYSGVYKYDNEINLKFLKKMLVYCDFFCYNRQAGEIMAPWSSG